MVLGLVLAGCSTIGSEEQEPPLLTEEYGCGYGFHIGSADQTAGLFVDYNDWEAAVSGTLNPTLAGDEWTAELRFGRDLFANWCDDVLEPGDPEPAVDEIWQLSGQIVIEEMPPADLGCGGTASATLTDVVARSDDGDTLSLGDLQVMNEAWGCFAG
jgi:hypothetical protein